MPAAKKGTASQNALAMPLNENETPVFRTCGSEMSDGARHIRSNTHAASNEPGTSPSAHA